MKVGPRRYPSRILLGLVLLLAAAAATVPSTTLAAVPRAGNVFSPRTGAELMEAAALATAEGTAEPARALEIRLAATTYVISSPLVLAAPTPIELAGPTTGDDAAVITNAAEPITLLRYSSEVGASAVKLASARRIHDVHFELRGNSVAELSAVELRSGGAMTNAYVYVDGQARNAYGIRMAPALAGPTSAGRSVAVADVQVVSDANRAAAVRMSPGAELVDADIEGGNPTVDVTEDGSDTPLSGVSILRSALIASSGTTSVLRVRPTVAPMTVAVGTTGIHGENATKLIDVVGATAPAGRVALTARNVTARGGAHSTAVSITNGVEATPSTVSLPGLLSVGSPIAVTCPAAKAPTVGVSLQGFYAAGTVPSGGCLTAATGRRTGDPKFRDAEAGDLRPGWGSVLIDGAPNAATGSGLPGLVGWSTTDLLGLPRDVRACGSTASGSTTVDIGAFEYQCTPPRALQATAASAGNRGLALLGATAVDDEPAEQDDLTFEWRLPDGRVLTGEKVQPRFAASGTYAVVVRAVDVSGLSV